MRLAGDYEELLEWTEARAPRIVVVRPLVLEAEGSLWEQRAGEVAEAITRIARSRAELPRRGPCAGVRGRVPRPATVRSPPTACTSPRPAPRSSPALLPRVIAELEREDEAAAATRRRRSGRMKRLHKVAVDRRGAGGARGRLLVRCSCRDCRRWGATGDEASRPLPGDDLIPAPLYATTHAITVQAPAEAVFPWLVQIGQNRGGFYTYDVLENLFRLDIHSADRIHPEWQDLRARQRLHEPRPGRDHEAHRSSELEPPARVRRPHRRPRRSRRRRPATSSRERSRPRGRSSSSRSRAGLVAAPHPLARVLARDGARRVRARLPARAGPLRHGARACCAASAPAPSAPRETPERRA